jgi:hypothetical protein
MCKSCCDIPAPEESEYTPFLHLLILFGPQQTGDAILFTGLLTQMLISSGNTFTDTPRTNVLPAIWASLNPVMLTKEISHPVKGL